MDLALRIARRTLFLTTLALGAVPLAVAMPTVVEFYEPDLNHYFITADPNEQAFVDTGAVGHWLRTGNNFNAGGPRPVCRFYGNGATNPATGAAFGPNSHFYTADAAECAGLKAAFNPAAKSWKFESNDFLITPSSNALCVRDLVPVYRAYNNGFARGVDSNHRITANLAAYQQTVATGWAGEGVVMCALPSAIPPAFFAMSSTPSTAPAPAVTLGLLAHPEFAWQHVEKSKGVFDFTDLDKYLEIAKKLGLVDPVTNVANVAITLAAGTPGWAVADPASCHQTSNGLSICTAPPDHTQDWADFVSALVQHYNGAGQPHIRYYELWNEFNISQWWTGNNAQLVTLAQAAYPIVHQDAYSQLLTPSVAGPVGPARANGGDTWMTNYLQAGGAAFADGGSFHGYMAVQSGVTQFPMPEQDATSDCASSVSCYSSIISRATQMRAVFDQNGLAGKPMYQTEGSWGDLTVTDLDTQVAWLSRFMLLQAGLRNSLNLQMAAWFAWAAPSFGWGNIQSSTGTPTAAGDAYTQVDRWLVGATVDAPCAGASNGTWTCTLTRAGGYVAQAVWNTNGASSYLPGAGYTQYRDLAGGVTPINSTGSVAIGPKPILVEKGVAAAPNAPNILLVLTDDQDIQMGTLDYMPNLKQLIADQGVTFSNFLVPLSLCCPSRTSILRGQFPHNTGVKTNALPEGGFERAYEENLEASTMATMLHLAGYRTALFGKYLNGYPNNAGALYIPPGWDEWYSPVLGNPYSEYNYWLNENGQKHLYGATASDYLTDVILGKAVSFIQRTPSSQPVFMYFATYAPHAPYTPAPRHAHLFPGLVAPKNSAFNEADVSDKPAYIRNLSSLTSANIATIDTDYRSRIQALQAVDEALATLVQTLASTGRLANTYIAFAADNGYHMGHHRLFEGKYTPYDTDLRIPLLIRGPGVPAGVTRKELAANIDLAPTFADFAGLAPYSFADGRSLKPLLVANPSTSWRQAFLLEEYQGEAPSSADPASLAPMSKEEATDPSSARGVREPPDADDLMFVARAKASGAPTIPSFLGYKTPDYKYIEYATGEKELYVAADPDEVSNAAGRVAAPLAAAASSYLKTLSGCAAEGCRTADAVAPPPLLTASIGVSPSAPVHGSPTTFSASANGTGPYSYTWTIDGSNYSGQSVALSLGAGNHSVMLDVHDAINAEVVATQTVTVH